MGSELEDNDIARPDGRATECRVCATRLAPDQRYCLACGTRRGALLHSVAQMLEGMAAHEHEPVARIEREEPQPETAGRGPVYIGPWTISRLPGPQALAAMLLASLGFGVLAGSIAPAPVQALVSAPLLLLVNHGASNSAANQGQGSDSQIASSQNATQTQQTITVTTPAPATPAPQSPAPSTVITPPPPTSTGPTAPTNLLGLPPVKHVFLVVLADQGFAQTFDPGVGDSYLSKKLVAQGELIEDYYAVAGSSLANGVALISGQGPTQATAANCPQYAPIAHPGSSREGQVVGSGCVYPSKTPTLASQLAKQKLTWRAYVDGMDTDTHVTPSTCRHPAAGAYDPNYNLAPNDPYVTWRNPFVYFSSLTTPKATCAKTDVGLGQLAKDLRTVKTTPSFSYIVPSPCEDGDATPCRPGAPSGLAPADTFLRKVLAEIKRSPAYKADGLIAITFDHAPQAGPYADSNACCATPPYPNMPSSPSSTTTTPTGTTTTPTTTTGTTTTPTTTTPPTDTTTTPTNTTTTTTPTNTTTTPTSGTTGPNPGDVAGQTTPTGGGGQVGLMLLSKYVKAGSVESIDYYNHFSLLATIENLFGLKRLGFASDPSLTLFDTGVFNNYTPGA